MPSVTLSPVFQLRPCTRSAVPEAAGAELTLSDGTLSGTIRQDAHRVQRIRATIVARAFLLSITHSLQVKPGQAAQGPLPAIRFHKHRMSFRCHRKTCSDLLLRFSPRPKRIAANSSKQKAALDNCGPA